MQISANKVVCFHFNLKNAEGETVDSSHDGEPSVYLHGADNIMPMLERRLVGLGVNDHAEISLDMLDAFGPRRDDLKQQVAVKHLKSNKRKLSPGDRVQMVTEQGQQVVTIVKSGRFQAWIDANHPMAGQDVTFEIDIVAVRDATAEELAHGHAHGPDGHSGH